MKVRNGSSARASAAVFYAAAGAALFGIAAVAGAAQSGARAGATTKAPRPAVNVNAGAVRPDGAELALTVGLTLNGDGSTCGTNTAVVAEIGDTIDFCYTVTNHSAIALSFSTLEDSVDGVVFASLPTPIAAGGGTYVHHRSVVARSTGEVVHSATWKAFGGDLGYTADDAAITPFVDIRQSGTPLTPGDNRTVAIALPFAFALHGVPSDTLCVGDNGGLILGRSFLACEQLNLYWNNVPLPSYDIGGATIFPYWDDFTSGGLPPVEDGLYWHVRGEPGSRELIVQWNKPKVDWPNYTPQRANFEAILREDGSLSFVYDHLGFGSAANPGWDDGGKATIGLQDADRSIVNQYSYATPLPHLPPSAIDWRWNATVLGAQADVDVEVSAAVLAVTPASIGAAAPSGSGTPVVAPLTIRNDGRIALDWSVDELPSSRAHFPRTRRSLAPIAAPLLSPADVAPDRDAGVPAYLFGTVPREYFWSLDLLRPETLTTLRIGLPANLSGASFVDNDFSKLYVIGFDGSFGFVDTVKGDLTPIGQTAPDPGHIGWRGLRWDAGSGKLYLTDITADRTSRLYTIDRTSGAVALVGPIAGSGLPAQMNVSAVAIAPDGLMYGVDAEAGVLLAIDKSTGAAAAIGSLGMQLPVPTGLDFAGAGMHLDFDPASGALYLVANEQYRQGGDAAFATNVYAVDRVGGTAVPLGPLFGSPSQGARAMAIARPWRTCVLPGEVSWLSVSPTSGTVGADAPPAEATVTLDPSGLADGLYSADLCISSNDPLRRRASVPVEFTVGTVAPSAAVAPSPMSVAIAVGASRIEPLTIANVGTRGSRLSYEITEAPTDCSAPADVAWLRAMPASGELRDGESAPLAAVGFDGSALEEGVHTAVLCVRTNDPAQPSITLPVELTVTPPDALFASGFETPVDGGEPRPGIYTDRAAFLTRVEPGYFENPFTHVTVRVYGIGYRYRQGDLAYTLATDLLPIDGGGFLSYTLPGVITTYDARAKIVVTFTGGEVTAVGGNFWATDADEAPIAMNVTVALSDGSRETFVASDRTDFRGFTSAVPITSVTIESGDSQSPSIFGWTSMDNLIVGRNAFPE
ncbi:hypothetical protein [Dokdonella sp.]|uniref:hypothetical protein n=1 Tax=Dokdonella sp. TaxID=2291710 RepID=UPI001B2A7E60|nr:hypothetical protein [Dokdonella sp.]MBO9663127.1 hypothetical protein [Dokdonella sp.]